VCDLETSRMGAPYIYDISRLRVKTSVCSMKYHCLTFIWCWDTKFKKPNPKSQVKV